MGDSSRTAVLNLVPWWGERALQKELERFLESFNRLRRDSEKLKGFQKLRRFSEIWDNFLLLVQRARKREGGATPDAETFLASKVPEGLRQRLLEEAEVLRFLLFASSYLEAPVWQTAVRAIREGFGSRNPARRDAAFLEVVRMFPPVLKGAFEEAKRIRWMRGGGRKTLRPSESVERMLAAILAAVFEDPDTRLIAAGALSPDGDEAGLLRNLKGLWAEGLVRGRLDRSVRPVEVRWSPSDPKLWVHVFCSARLTEAWTRLDEAFRDRAGRFWVPAEFRDGETVLVNLYAGTMPGA